MTKPGVTVESIDAVLADNEYRVRSVLAGFEIPMTPAGVVELLFGETSPWPERDDDPWDYLPRVHEEGVCFGLTGWECLREGGAVDVAGLSGTPFTAADPDFHGDIADPRIWPDHPDHTYPLADDVDNGWPEWVRAGYGIVVALHVRLLSVHAHGAPFVATSGPVTQHRPSR